MVYIDLNMVRAGVVDHPSKWPFCGYNKIQDPPSRYSLIDRRQLMRLLGSDNSETLSVVYNNWLENVLRKGGHVREEKWTQSIAVGGKFFIEDVKDKLGFRAIGKKIVSAGDLYQLKESIAPYSCDFNNKMSTLRPKNSFD